LEREYPGTSKCSGKAYHTFRQNDNANRCGELCSAPKIIRLSGEKAGTEVIRGIGIMSAGNACDLRKLSVV
jgi:hypothetical protein